MELSDRNRVYDTLTTSVCTDTDVSFVVAFGSQPRGAAIQASDLDVAVKFADALSDRERFTKLCFLSGTLQQDNSPFVDCSDIETLPIDIAHDAVDGTFVCGDKRALSSVNRISKQHSSTNVRTSDISNTT